jgi:hypothetical protein
MTFAGAILSQGGFSTPAILVVTPLVLSLDETICQSYKELFMSLYDWQIV